MSNQQLDICDIHELLFEPENNNNCKFDFFNTWNDITCGEYNRAFVEACKLTVLAALSANSIKTTEQQAAEPSSTLSALMTDIGDITNAAAAVVDDSPLMDTPYLDPCINTPYTPASAFTPSLAQFQNYSPYINNSLSNLDNLGDIQVSSYLKKNASWPEFDLNSSSEATGLQLFQSSSSLATPQVLADVAKPDATNTDEDDSLFPPLPSDNTLSDNTATDSDNAELFNSDDFTSNLFDGEFLFDEYFIEPVVEQTTLPPSDIKSTTADILPIVLPSVLPVSDETAAPNKRKQDNVVDEPIAKRRKFKASSGEERKFVCDVCNISFSRRYNLGTHIKTHDRNRTKAHACTTCKKQFDRKHDLARHIATVHNGERAFSCNLCSNTFSRKDALGRHLIQKHTVPS